MDKIAQKRSVLNKLREMTNISGKAAESFFNPQFQKVMEDLREKDDNIRSIVAGEVIGNGDPGNDPIAFKTLLKTSKTNLNRREYMSATADLGRFHKKVSDIVNLIDSLNNSINEVHHEFLFKDLDDEKKQHLQNLKTRWARSQKIEMLKEASGIMDFFHNIMSNRGRALGLYEKRYPKQVAKLKKDASLLQSKSEALLAIILTTLKEMASARATRNPEQYIKSAEKIKRAYQNYDGIFKEFYNSNVKGFLDKVEQSSPAPTATKSNDGGLGNQEVPELNTPSNVPFDLNTTKKVVVAPSAGKVEPTGETEYAPPSEEFGTINLPTPTDFSDPSIPPPPKVPTNLGPPVPDTTPQLNKPEMESNPQRQTLNYPSPAKPRETMIFPSNIPNTDTNTRKTLMQTSSSHQEFYRTLESLAGEDTRILASYIRKYASLIQNSDPLKSIQLFKIAKSIKE